MAKIAQRPCERALRPDLKCVLTTTTTTGHALAEKTAPEWMRVLYAPLDFWPVMRRALREDKSVSALVRELLKLPIRRD